MVKVAFTLIIFLMASCIATDKSQGDYSEYAQRKSISLEQSEITSNQFIYENSKAIIYIPLPVLMSYIEENLTDKDLCREKKKNLKELSKGIDAMKAGASLFYIESLPDPETNRDMGQRYYKEYKRTYIEPYGYAPLSKSSVSSIRAGKGYRWVVSDILLSGKAKVYNKRANKLEESVVYEVVDFKDGHGGELLLFEDSSLFFLVETYSDIVWPDFNCMNSTELKNYGP